MAKLKIETGQKIGRLTVLKEGKRKILPSGLKQRTVDCLCDCGKETNVLLLHFVRKRTLSCGCLKNKRNGLSETKLYKIYKAIQERCDGKTKDSHRYLGRGITVCDEWKKNYMSFISWALNNGYKEGLQIDRKDNNKGYSPENCRWVTSEVNNNNRHNTFIVLYNGKKEPFMPLMRKLNLINNAPAIRARIKRGWSAQKAIDTKIREGKYFKNY